MINLIVARSRNNVIGNKDGIPWKIKGEQLFFKEMTTGNIVIMGRKTYTDIGKPLPNRINIVISRTQEYEYKDEYTALITRPSLKDAINTVSKWLEEPEIYISGGRLLYKEAIPLVDRMYITDIDMEVPEDDSTVFFPDFDESRFDKYTTEIIDGLYTRNVYINKESAWKFNAKRKI